VKPTVLIAATSQWATTARLAMALANAGCIVDAVCPSRHPLRKTSAVRQAHSYGGLTPLKSFAAAITATRPDFLLSGDDPTTQHLHHLYYRERRRGKEGALICALIEHSLGAAESFPVVYARTTFIETAQEEGIRVPKTEVIENTDDLRRWVDRMGFPTVLKANGTTGGEGVRIVHTLEDAELAFRTLQAPPLLARAVKRALVDGEEALVWPSLLRRRSVVNAQVFVAGREATSAIACWKGSAMASLHFEVLIKGYSAGPATVMRLIDNAEMSAAAEKMARRLKLSGLHGFDFMLESETGNPYLIEINPRATQVGHLSLGPGRDLPAALYAAVSGQAVKAAPTVTENDTIALFPQEWTRDPASPFLRSGYHDVPWEEPELVRACLRSRRKWIAWRSQQTRIKTFSAVRLP
jgi:hypothetical protein